MSSAQERGLGRASACRPAAPPSRPRQRQRSRHSRRSWSGATPSGALPQSCLTRRQVRRKSPHRGGGFQEDCKLTRGPQPTFLAERAGHGLWPLRSPRSTPCPRSRTPRSLCSGPASGAAAPAAASHRTPRSWTARWAPSRPVWSSVWPTCSASRRWIGIRWPASHGSVRPSTSSSERCKMQQAFLGRLLAHLGLDASVCCPS
mmetsp:Transcript_17147/g.47534  ORF Transcript_17147/g.47534 Transcript_17147/m.47534 type:complete len:203 (-) Transcript_17147:90-698(-)